MQTAINSCPADWLTVAEVCSHLGVSRSTFYRKIYRKNLHPVHVNDGGHPRFLPEDVSHYINALKRGAK